MNDKHEEGSDYQYDDQQDEFNQEEQGVTEEVKMPHAKGSIVDKLKNRKVIFVAVFVVVVVVVYNFLGGAPSSNQIQSVNNTSTFKPHPNLVPKAQLPAQPKSFNTQPAPVAKPVAPKPVVTAPAPATVKAQTIDALADKLAKKMRAQTEKQVSTYRAAFNARINTLQQQALAANEKIADLQDQASQLQSQVKTLKSHLGHLQNVQNTLAKNQGYSFNASGEMNMGNTVVHSPVKASPGAVMSQAYTVQAVIQGRAWLSSANGTTKTVTVGSVVPGYGHVTAIDSLNGIVSTSSGKQLTSGE